MPRDDMNEPSKLHIACRIAGYAVDRLTGSTDELPVLSAVSVGSTTVGMIAALEGSLHLQPQPQHSLTTRFRFIARYAVYNIIPSLIWATQAPQNIVASSRYLSKQMKNHPTNHTWLYETLPPHRALYARILCALRGAVAGSMVLSNVVVLTSVWHRANKEYAERIRLGREPPFATSESCCCTIRLAGARSDVTELSLHRRGPRHFWPIYEDASLVQGMIAKYATTSNNVPMYWQVNDGQYSKDTSWQGMKIPKSWLYSVNGQQLLYLEADATSGDESALSLQHHGSLVFSQEGDFEHKTNTRQLWNRLRYSKRGTMKKNALAAFLGMDIMDTPIIAEDLDLDLKEMAQGFRCLKQLAEQGTKEQRPIQVQRIVLVDPTVLLESGGGRQTSVRQQVEELGLADIIIDARTLCLHAILAWLEQAYDDEEEESGDGSPKTKNTVQERPVILETPSKIWFQSIKQELKKHGYNVMDRSETSHLNNKTTMPPMLVYERSSADTVNTIRQYLERGIVQENNRVCALLTCHDGLDQVNALNEELAVGNVGCVCSSDLHDRAFEWVKAKTLAGIPADMIQKELDSGARRKILAAQTL